MFVIVSVYLSWCLYVCHGVCMSLMVSVCLSWCLYVCHGVCMSVMVSAGLLYGLLLQAVLARLKAQFLGTDQELESEHQDAGEDMAS